MLINREKEKRTSMFKCFYFFIDKFHKHLMSICEFLLKGMIIYS
jgi:hypothetical protein